MSGAEEGVFFEENSFVRNNQRITVNRLKYFVE